MDEKPGVAVVIETTLGRIEIVLWHTRAPITSSAVLRLIDAGRYSACSSIYRVVRSDTNDRGDPKIDVVQGGMTTLEAELPHIPHESTRVTGLRHRDGAISLARRQVDTATGATFFICIGDQPELDWGGRRHADGQGFAVFGQVRAGMEVVRAIHRLPAAGHTSDPYQQGQLLDPPVPIVSMARK
jgi:peptidyl-prolyl cis-trans isomerase A (cyclophilin A)